MPIVIIQTFGLRGRQKEKKNTHPREKKCSKETGEQLFYSLKVMVYFSNYTFLCKCSHINYICFTVDIYICYKVLIQLDMCVIIQLNNVTTIFTWKDMANIFIDHSQDNCEYQ